ncbi:RICIN domain-containing protein, partial [Streptomyces sp. NPDC045251]|uniref:RICIN domain-containing protein n=1 Tax=unclassified Streptomyces TaxID=2593676 RepID=UPI0034116646
RSGVDPTEVEGTYVQRGFLPRWLATFFGFALALSIAFVMIWIAYKPQVRSSASEQVEQAGAALAPSPSPSASPETLPSAAESAPEVPKAPEQPEEPKGDGGGGKGGGGGEPEKPAKKKPVVPAQDVLLRNTASDMCAELPGREKGKINGPVQQAVCDGTDGDNQIWDLEVQAEKGPAGVALFQIRNVKDLLCMDLGEYGSRPVGTPVSEFHCDGTTADNQLWWIDKQASGDYWIRNFASNNTCLDADETDGPLFARLRTATCTSSGEQEWKIVPVKKD